MGLREYYSLLSEFHDALRVYRYWDALWKASVLVSTDWCMHDVDEAAESEAVKAWERLEAIHARLTGLHTRLGIPGSPVELPIEEFEERVSPLGEDDA